MNQTSRQEGGHICEPEVSIFFSTAFTTQFYQKKITKCVRSGYGISRC